LDWWRQRFSDRPLVFAGPAIEQLARCLAGNDVLVTHKANLPARRAGRVVRQEVGIIAHGLRGVSRWLRLSDAPGVIAVGAAEVQNNRADIALQIEGLPDPVTLGAAIGA